MTLKTDLVLKTFLNAAADLINQAVKEAVAQDPPAAAGLAQMIRDGALMTLKASIGNITGMAVLSIEVVEPSGLAHTLMAAELNRDTTH